MSPAEKLDRIKQIIQQAKPREDLCYRDKRSPYRIDEETAGLLGELEESLDEDCFCDSCYHGKHPLADALLEIEGII